MWPNSVARALDELAPGGALKKRLRTSTVVPDVARRRLRVGDRAAAVVDLVGGVGVARAAEDARVGDRADARQRLAAEAHGARCGTGRRRACSLLVACDANASGSSSGGMPPPSSITRISSRPPSSTSTSDLRRAGVDRVLDQLLHDRRRPLDHLAGGDAVDERRRELLDLSRSL